MTKLFYTIPCNMAVALINDDPTGLSDEDQRELDQFLKTLSPGYFTLGETEPEFTWSNDVNNLGCDCLELPYILL